MRCVTERPVIGTEHEAQQLLAQQQSPSNAQAEVVRCPYCGFWHLVEPGSTLMR